MIMTTGRINELRDYIYGLKQTRARPPWRIPSDSQV